MLSFRPVRPTPVAAALAVLLCASAAAPLRARTQPPAAPAAPDSGAAAPIAAAASAVALCPTGPISFIFIANSSIFEVSDPNLQGRFAWAYRTANALHIRTRESVIRRELLFEVGDCFDAFLLAESERLLRGYSFLSRVDIFGVPQPDGTYHVIVDTRDEWSTHVDVRVRMNGALSIEGLRVEETNLLGTGQRVGAFLFQRDVTRNFGVTYYTPQLLGTRWHLHGDAGRTRAGTFVREELTHPFVGEVSRWAARQSFLRDDRYFEYVLGDAAGLHRSRLLVPIREKFFDLAVIRRIGPPGRTTVLGSALSHQELSYPGSALFVPDGQYADRVPADSALTGAVLRQAVPLRNIRVFGLLGQRNIWWIKQRGLDSMRGQQDVALGAEALLALGRSLPALEADDDVFATLTLYTGLLAGETTMVGRGRIDARRNLDAPAGAPEWEDLFAELELLGYLRTAWLPGQSLFLRAAGAGAWNTHTPFQLTLGGERALRGYGPERMPGGRRFVLTAENRLFFGWPAAHLFDLGGTLFGDLGRILPGDAPFGADSGWRGSAGVGLRASFPAGSRTTYRFDVAWPAGGGLGDFRVILSVGEALGLTAYGGDLQFLRSRPEGVAGNLMRFN